jgi:chromatin remodeling complex protein RSC6
MAKTAKKKTARKANAAFMKPMTPSAALGEVIGDKPMPRTEVTKKLWAYIKKNGLQDARTALINADDKLKPVFAGEARSACSRWRLVSKRLK